MKAQPTIIIIGLALVLVTSPLLASQGKALYEKSCTKCHTTEVFTRENRGVKSLEGLNERVKQCSIGAQAKWGHDEIKTVVDYLNKNFYKF